MFTQEISLSAALFAGLLSFFSPCVLPLIPAYFMFITGFSLDELTGGRAATMRGRVIGSTLAFVLGFSLVFILLGASASFLGRFISQYSQVIRIIGGLLIILLGIHLTGLIRIRPLEVEKRVHLSRKPVHFMGTFVIGMAFGAGWSPCIGPLLGSILILAGNQETIGQGVLLLGVYSAGLALPFILLSVFINFLLVFLQQAKKALRYINPAAGILLIVTGILLMAGKLGI